jgi:hypothetical protein
MNTRPAASRVALLKATEATVSFVESTCWPAHAPTRPNLAASQCKGAQLQAYGEHRSQRGDAHRPQHKARAGGEARHA